jgi:hypothetical protein
MTSQANDANVPQPRPTPPHLHEVPMGMDLVNHVAQCLGMGCDPADIRKQLIAFGFTDANAEKVIADTAEWMRTNPYAGKPMPASPLYWAISHSGLVVGVIACIVGVAAWAWPTSSDNNLQFAIGGTAITFGVFAILWDVFMRVVR